jgi:S-adenosylmethionine synthetase
VQHIAREVIRKIGYTSEYMFEANSVVFFLLFKQSADINQGVDRANPEDQERVTKE